jgi:hypothetical protein
MGRMRVDQIAMNRYDFPLAEGHLIMRVFTAFHYVGEYQNEADCSTMEYQGLERDSNRQR